MISALQFTSVTKRFHGTMALNALDLSVAPGEVVALLGRNGAGKSTAISLALGLLQPDAGSVRLFGTDTGRIEARRRAGVLMQRSDLPGTARVHELIRLACAYYPAPMKVAEAAAAAGVGALLGRQYGRLSGGQRRAVQFALAVCGRPQVLILDEPTAAMDVEARDTLWGSVRTLVRGGCAVLMTSHYSEEVEEFADRVCVLSGGTKVAEASLSELRGRPDIEKCFAFERKKELLF